MTTYKPEEPKVEVPEDLKDNDFPKNSSFSESLSLFHSLQVLANEEEERALSNSTASSMFMRNHEK